MPTHDALEALKRSRLPSSGDRALQVCCAVMSSSPNPLKSPAISGVGSLSTVSREQSSQEGDRLELLN